MGFEYAWQYRIGKLCSTTDNSTARCVAGLRGGVRYITLKEDGTEDSENAWGEFLTLQNAWSFKFFEAGSDKETGYLRLNLSGSYFSHNGVDSDDFFAGMNDSEGNPVKFDKSYLSTSISTALYINKFVNISYTKWYAHSDDGVDDQETVSINFDLLHLY